MGMVEPNDVYPITLLEEESYPTVTECCDLVLAVISSIRGEVIISGSLSAEVGEAVRKAGWKHGDQAEAAELSRATVKLLDDLMKKVIDRRDTEILKLCKTLLTGNLSIRRNTLNDLREKTRDVNLSGFPADEGDHALTFPKIPERFSKPNIPGAMFDVLVAN
jgi:hypothetical protein